ncbi:hypothetical protein DMENIID0001_107880 [Sergentomyia squamirostris]
MMGKILAQRASQWVCGKEVVFTVQRDVGTFTKSNANTPGTQGASHSEGWGDERAVRVFGKHWFPPSSRRKCSKVRCEAPSICL